MIEFRKLKIGEAFTFGPHDPRVWVKCRGGFREGRGGQLQPCSPGLKVIRWEN